MKFVPKLLPWVYWNQVTYLGIWTIKQEGNEALDRPPESWLTKTNLF